MAVDVARAAAISDRHAQHRDSIILKLVKLLLGIWGDFGGSRDPEVVAGLAALSAVRVASATSQTRKLTRSYLTSMLRELDAIPAPLPAPREAYPRSGVSALDVYSRPAKQFVYALSQGSSVEEARTIAEDRLTEIAEQDVLLAEREESQRLYEATPKVIGYRRVIHPELSRSGTCGLCVVASQRLYSTGDLLDIHGGDNCTTMPVVKGDDPGFRLNAVDLKQVYAAAGSNRAEDLVNTRITIKEHGELGPILVKQGDHFRTPKEAGRPAYVRPTPETMRAANRKARDDAQSKLDDLTGSLSKLSADLGTGPEGRSLNQRRAALTQATRSLAAYIASLDSAAKSLR